MSSPRITRENATKALRDLRAANRRVHKATIRHRDETLKAEDPKGSPRLAIAAAKRLEAAKEAQNRALEFVELLTNNLPNPEPRKTSLEEKIHKNPEIVETAKKANAEEARLREEARILQLEESAMRVQEASDRGKVVRELIAITEMLVPQGLSVDVSPRTPSHRETRFSPKVVRFAPKRHSLPQAAKRP